MLLLQTVKYKPLTIRSRIFRAATQIDRACDLARRRVNYGDTLALAVEGEHSSSCGIESDRVRLLVGRHVSDGHKRLQIENCYRLRLAVTHKSFAKIGGQRDAMHSELIRNGPDNAAGINIDHLDLGCVRHIQAASAFVQRKVVSTTIARKRYFLDDGVTPRARHSRME